MELEGDLTEVLICTFMVADDLEHLYIYLLVIWLSSFSKCFFKSSAISNIDLPILLISSTSLYIFDTPYFFIQFKYCETLLPVYGLHFSLYVVFDKQKLLLS